MVCSAGSGELPFGRERRRLNREMPDKMKRINIYPEDSSWDPGNRKVKQIDCTGRRASLTLEAALTVPLFLLAWLAVICVMDIYRIQAEVKTSLSESAENWGCTPRPRRGRDSPRWM